MAQTILSAKLVYWKMLLNGHDHHSMSTGRDVPFRGFDRYDEVRTARRRLPHWRQPGVSYFVTFRLADSVPQPLLRQWRHERAIWLQLHPQPILQGIKGVSANRCNKLLGHKSAFWMDESYDHVVRDAKELRTFRNYIGKNPDKAGLQPEGYSLHLRNVLIT